MESSTGEVDRMYVSGRGLGKDMNLSGEAESLGDA